MGGIRRIKRGLSSFRDPGLKKLARDMGTDKDGLLADIKREIKRYANEWEENAEFLEEHGIYRQIADFADFRKGEWWLDLGCGSGNLISEVCKRVETTAIGIDINTYLLGKIKERLEKEGFDVNYHMSYEIMEDPVLGFRLVTKDNGFHIEEGKPNIILDDMRFPDIAVNHLPKQRLDRIVYTLPGGYISFQYEFLKKLTQNVYNIFIAMNKVIASHACRLLSEGKEFVAAVRISIPEEAKDDNVVGFPNLKPYFETTEEVYSDYPEEAERLNSVSGSVKIVDPTSPSEKRSIKMQLKKYRRTSVPFSSYSL